MGFSENAKQSVVLVKKMTRIQIDQFCMLGLTHLKTINLKVVNTNMFRRFRILSTGILMCAICLLVNIAPVTAYDIELTVTGDSFNWNDIYEDDTGYIYNYGHSGSSYIMGIYAHCELLQTGEAWIVLSSDQFSPPTSDNYDFKINWIFHGGIDEGDGEAWLKFYYRVYDDTVNAWITNWSLEATYAPEQSHFLDDVYHYHDQSFLYSTHDYVFYVKVWAYAQDQPWWNPITINYGKDGSMLKLVSMQLLSS